VFLIKTTKGSIAVEFALNFRDKEGNMVATGKTLTPREFSSNDPAWGYSIYSTPHFLWILPKTFSTTAH
jgi:hypothetical protein